MSEQLIKAFQQFITPARIENFKNIFGDEPDQVNNAFSTSLHVVINGILSKCSTVDGTGKILHAVREVNDKNVLGNLDAVFSGSGELSHYGGTLLNNILGDKENHIVQKMADTTGAKSSSAHSILRITSLLVAGLLGKHVSDSKMDNKGFIHYLITGIGTLLPAGIATNFGLAGSGDIKHKLQSVAYTLSGETGPHTVINKTPEPKEKKKGMGILLPVLLLALVGALAWWFFKDKKNEDIVLTAPPPADTVAAIIARPSVVDTVARTITLPDGVLFHVSKGTMEYKLVEFLNDNNRQAGKDVWFDFDDVNFDIDKAALTAESKMQLDNIAAILKAYPKTKVKVGGYTDKTGNEDHNVKLSQERADTVFSALKEKGVNADQLLAAEGYGSQFATMPAEASTPNRRIDRRMALSVREK
jgi:outer membrane protein OmpA-like peptidoglycan-associated protein/uncharacterized membrane protein YeaQ/YmgE (transglycosylase-associated protein family)